MSIRIRITRAGERRCDGGARFRAVENRWQATDLPHAPQSEAVCMKVVREAARLVVPDVSPGFIGCALYFACPVKVYFRWRLPPQGWL